ncbi:MAG: ABC transporter substrate-binding protein, partial [Actinomycetota bacterium]
VTPLNANIVEGLFRLTPDLTLEPVLAESWSFSAPNTWRFKIRSGITFHDGKPLNAEAVKVGLFDRTAASGGGQIRAGTESAKVVDEMTVDFTPTVTNLRVPEMLAHPGRGVYSPGSDLEKPIGTGPFKFVSYEKDMMLVVERFDGYWGEKAKSERVEFHFFPSSDARVAALEEGKVDVVFAMAPHKDEAAGEAGYELATSTIAGTSISLFANAGGLPPYNKMADPALRKAVALAIDRRALASQLGSDAVESQAYVPKEVLGPNASAVKGHPHNDDEARRALDAAGWKLGDGGIREKAGERLKLTLVTGYPTADANEPVPAFVASQLRSIGIEVEVTASPTATDYAQALVRGDGDLYVEQGTQSDADPAFLPLLVYTWEAGGTYNKLFGPKGAFDAALGRALTTPDPEQARPATAEALHELVDVHQTVLPLVAIKRVYAYNPGVTGLVPHPSPFCMRWDAVAYTGG